MLIFGRRRLGRGGFYRETSCCSASSGGTASDPATPTPTQGIGILGLHPHPHPRAPCTQAIFLDTFLESVKTVHPLGGHRTLHPHSDTLVKHVQPLRGTYLDTQHNPDKKVWISGISISSMSLNIGTLCHNITTILLDTSVFPRPPIPTRKTILIMMLRWGQHHL